MNCGFRIMSLRAKRGNLDCGLETDLRPAASGLRGLVVQTKPNLGRMPMPPNTQNEPNLPGGAGRPAPAPRPSGLVPGPEAIVRNKPNLGRPGPGWARRAKDAKQSQFGGK
jgi:hypothetical protein